MKGFKNLSQIITLSGAHQKDGRNLNDVDLGVINNASLIYDENSILWIGESTSLPSEYKDVSFYDGTGKTLTPEIVDPHTHLVFGGNRAKEYSMRLNGADYEAIGKAGGGILSTVNATNEESFEELLGKARERVKRIHSYGVGTIEIKTGYALNIDKEIECLKVINQLKKEFAPRVQIISTLMPAHAIPPTFKSGRDYLDKIVIPCLEKALAEEPFDATDIFHEEGYFSSEDTEYFFNWCKTKSINIKSHADEFHDNDGAYLASKFNCLSADHLLSVSEKGIQALSNSQTIATLLPGTGFFLGKKQSPARALLDGGAKVAIASDYNPGSCHCDNLLLIAALAAPTLKLKLVEVWCAITHNSAHALGLLDQGVLIVGKRPRFSLFDTPQVDEITYNWGRNLSIPIP